MQMNWRLLTAINAAIALVTVSAIIFAITRRHAEHTRTAVRSNPTREQSQAAEREAKARVEALDDLSQARVDDLGAVPAAELTHLMDRASPEQLAALALKFNDAPVDGRTLGGMGVFFQAWTELDPKAALTGAFQLKDVALRKLAANTVVYAASPSAGPELITFLAEHPDKDLSMECKNSFLQPLIGSWALLDPEAAANYVDEIGDTKSSFGYDAKRRIAYAWGTLDPSSALHWVEKQKGNESVNADSLFQEAIIGWCLKDMAGASNYVQQHLDDPSARSSVRDVAQSMCTRSIEDATNWAARLPAGEARSDAQSQIASVWTEKDPAAAAHWVSTLPEDEQTNLVRTIASNWVDSDWNQASQWINSLTGAARDQALAVAVRRDGTTPIESLSLAQTMKDDDMRNGEIENLIRRWAATDAKAAEGWVNGSSLSEEQRQKLLTTISETQDAATEATAERVIIEH
ncbi:MAG TPA: hypothetical protein VEP30_09195 [Chthoniobacterales bacterium]|nr:hypothetical protein [Chthoniobacterales bacterium]